MFHVKHFGIILEHPNINLDKLKYIINEVINQHLVPIIILQDGYSFNNHLDVRSKIRLIRDNFPHVLREDNFYIMPKEVTYNKDRNEWKHTLKKVVKSINNTAFGYEYENMNDKVFIVNLNNHVMIKNKYLFISDELDSIITDLYSITDIMNISSYYDNNILGKFDPYITTLFKNRQFDEIYFDENISRNFISRITATTDNKAFIYMEDSNYIDLMKKYDLGSQLYSGNKITLDNTDLETMSTFLHKNRIDFNFDIEEKVSHNKNVSKTDITIGKNISIIDKENNTATFN